MSAVTERFAALVAGLEPSIRLDEAALLVAAHAYPVLDVDRELRRVDALAEVVRTPTLDGLLRALFDEEGFAGDRSDYYDPRNSFLNDVIDRRVGIPITLSILTLEVGRRVGVPLAPVSMPSHFLLRDKVDPTLFVDPFARGARFDAGGAAARFRALQGDDAPFTTDLLEPVGARAVVARLLANLKAIYRARADRQALAWVLRLRVLVPGVPRDERRELASALAGVGRFDEAADELDVLAAAVGDDAGGRHAQAAARLRARLN
jgi:regulator of sirC expression with transglutaminase-like and TPR domain